MDKLHQFYCSKAWRDLSFRLKIERGGKCERTGEVFADMSQLIAHHKIELTEDNVDDPSIALNPDNIEIISHREHNKEHRRFGYQKEVYVVYGSPLSGKTTMVRDMMQYGDIVLDIDALWQAVTFQPEYVKPTNCRFNIFALRDNLLDQIKTRYGQWYTAWVVMSLPDKYERERLAQTLGAELIYCESTKEECLERLEQSGKPESWLQYILDWWERYERG
jgi:hypothetical protein